MRWSQAIVTVIVSFVPFSPQSAFPAEDLIKEEVAVRNYSYEGIRVGMAENDFLRRYPLAKPQESGKRDVTAWYLHFDRGQRRIQVECYQGQIFYMGVTFRPGMLARIGGREAVEQTLTNTLGMPELVRGSMSYWNFARVERQVGYRQSADGGALLLIIDTAVDRQQRLQQVKDLDLGF